MPLETVQSLERQRNQLRSELAQAQDMRQGTLTERYRRCGKSNCHCAQAGSQGHGPSFSLTRAIAGKTKTRIIPAHVVSLTREQLAEFRRFRELSRQFLEVSEQLCEARLGAGMKSPEAAAKKKPSRRR